MENKNITSFIHLVVDENLAQAKDVINDILNERLGLALESKFEEYAPSLFEGKGSKPDFLDLDKDGNTEESMKSAAKDAEEGSTEDDEAEDEESDEEEEEEESEDEEDDEA